MHDRVGHLNLDDGSAGALGLAPHHKAAGMALDVHSCLVHDVGAHGIQNSHLATPQEDLHTPAAAQSSLTYALPRFLHFIATAVDQVAVSAAAA